MLGTIIKKWKRSKKEYVRYFTTSIIHSGDKYVFARKIIKTGLSKKIVKVWLKRATLSFGEFKPKGD